MMELFLFAIFLARSCLDSIFEAIRIGPGGLTAGALLNVAILAVVVTAISLRGMPALAIKVWLPFLVVAGLSVAWAPDSGDAIRLLLVLCTYAAIFAIPFLLGRRVPDSRFIRAIVYSSIVPVVFGIVQYIGLHTGSGRLQSTFLHPNVFAFYLVIIVGVIYFLLASPTAEIGPRVRVGLIAYSGVLITLMILTQTRGAWAATLPIVAVYALLVDRRFLLALLLLPALLFVPAVSDRLSDLGRGGDYTGQLGEDGINSYAWRELMWGSALNDVADSPVFGKGLGSFGPNSLVFFPLVDPTANYSSKGVGAHSVYVQTAYETGFVGFVCYVWIFGSLLYRAFRNRLRDRRGAVVVIAIIISYMVADYSDNMLDYGSVNLYFWGFLGIMFSRWERQSRGVPMVRGSLAPQGEEDSSVIANVARRFNGRPRRRLPL